MKLKKISQLLFIFFLAAFVSSCNSDTEYSTTTGSSDAQVYSFALRALPYTAADTVHFPILAKTKFAIDQFRELIYNPDSLPFQMNRRKFYMAVGFSSASVSNLQLEYPNDSIVDWNGSDSVDFDTQPLFPKLKVTAPDGNTSITYTIDLRIRKIDPDTIIWKKMTAQPSTVGKQRTILIGDTLFYTFSIDVDNKLYVYTAKKSTLEWSARTPVATASGLSASTVVLDNIAFFNKMFFAVDNAQKGYTSTDGINWTLRNNSVHSILGVVPGATIEKDFLLVITENAGKYYFAKTVDMETLDIVSEISNNPISNEVSNEFPSRGFSSVTSYDRTKPSNNILTLTGGTDFNNVQKNLTWAVRTGTNRLEIVSNQAYNNPLEAKPGIATFFYNQYLYALSQNQFYKTTSLGYKWVLASNKERLHPDMPLAWGQTVIVDNQNHIWVFGGVSDNGATPVREVWRGRLNSLIPKQ